MSAAHLEKQASLTRLVIVESLSRLVMPRILKEARCPQPTGPIRLNGKPMDSINLPIATVVIILIQLGGGIWFGSNISSRVSAVENRLESAEILPVGSAGKISEMSDRLARIETKLELLMEFNK